MIKSVGKLAVVLLAAGASTRMRGADKLLQPIEGVPVLRRQAVAMTKLALPVIVTLPPDRPERRAVLAGLNVAIVEVPDAAKAMAASIRAGVSAAGDVLGLAILPADMPEITAQDMADLLARFAGSGGDSIVQGTAQDGRPGHPVLFPSRLFPALARLTGDSGARTVLRGETVVPVALPAQHALTDLDTPEEWQDWAKRNPKSGNRFSE